MLTLLNTRRRHPGRLFHKAEPQIFDLLQLTRVEFEYKSDFLRLKRRLHKWNTSVEITDDAFLLRKKTQAAALTYLLVRRERIRAFREYINRLPARNNSLRKAA